MEKSSFQIKNIIDSLKNNLRQDQVLFQQAYEEFAVLTPLFPDKSYKDIKEFKTSLAEKCSNNSQVINSNNKTRELMLTTELNQRNALDVYGRNLEPPQNGFPGLGEYDQRKKLFLQERKKDYINYLNEHNLKPRRRSNASLEKSLDYEGLLAQKRQLEYDYRQVASDSYINNGLLKSSKSEGNVNNAANYNNVGVKTVQNFNSPNNSDQLYPRPHSYPTEINFGLSSNFNNSGRGDNFNDFGKRSASNIHLLSYNTDHESRRFPLSESLSSLSSSNRWRSEEERRLDYQSELQRQVEDDRMKRQKLKDDEERLNKKLEEENRIYDPWGRGGGGAPRKDRYGNVITSRNLVEDFTKEKPKIKPPSDVEPNYTVGHRSPPPMARSPLIRDERKVYDSYKEELKRQIEDKKLQDQLEKEKERQEDAKLAQRIQEQQDKMQREFEEEQKKHKIRDEDRRRRNEDLQRKHEDERKEVARRRREFNDDKRRSNYEEKEKLPNRNDDKDNLSVATMDSSPPVPSIKTKHNSEFRRDSKDSNNLSSQRQSRRSGSKSHILSQLTSMRQQLEKEQLQIQDQMKKLMDGNYDSYDNRPKAENFHENQSSSSSNGRALRKEIERKDLPDELIYRPATRPLRQHENDLEAPKDVSYTERRILPKVSGMQKLPPAALSMRSLDGFAPLQGDSLFLGVDNNYDSAPASQWRPHNQLNNNTEHHLNSGHQRNNSEMDRLADLEAARKRYLNTVNNDPDGVNAESFLDVYLART